MFAVAVLFLVSELLPSGEVSVAQAADSLRVMRESMGAARVYAEVSNIVRFPSRDPDKVYQVKSILTAVLDGPKYNIMIDREAIYFPDAASEAEIVVRPERYIFDGDRQARADLETKRVVITPGPSPPHTHPLNLWLNFSDHPLEDILISENTVALPPTIIGGSECLGFETPLDEYRVLRVWFSTYETNLVPVRIESGLLDASGQLDLRTEVEVLAYGSTSTGLPFPVLAQQKLYSVHTGEKICFTERHFHFIEFENQIEITDDAFDTN